jgi:hypothetical protein
VDAVELIGFLEACFQEFLASSTLVAVQFQIRRLQSLSGQYLIEPSSGAASAKTARDLTYSLRCLFLRVENELA